MYYVNCLVANGISCKLAFLSQVQTKVNLTRLQFSTRVAKTVEFVLAVHMLLGVILPSLSRVLLCSKSQTGFTREVNIFTLILWVDKPRCREG